MMPNRIVNLNIPQLIIVKYSIDEIYRTLSDKTQAGMNTELACAVVFRLVSFMMYELTAWVNKAQLDALNYHSLIEYIKVTFNAALINRIIDLIDDDYELSDVDVTLYKALILQLTQSPNWLVSPVFELMIKIKSLALFVYLMQVKMLDLNNILINIDYTIAPIGYYRNETFVSY